MSYDENQQVEDPWANIVDLMSALVLVLFLAVIFFIMNYSTINDQLKVEHQNLVQTQADLKASQVDLRNLDQRFTALRQKEQKLQLDKHNLITEKQRLLADKNQLIADRNQLQADKERLLGDKNQLISDRNQLQADKERLLTDKNQLILDRNQLLSEQSALTQQRDLLKQEKQKLVGDKKALLGEKKALIGDKNALLVERESLTRNQNSLLSDKDALLGEKRALMAEKQALMADKQDLLKDKKALADRTRLLNQTVQSLQHKIKEMEQRQSNLMGSLAKAFSSSEAQGISVDRKKGKIVLKSEILFESGQSDLTDRGKVELQRVAQALNQVIFQPQFAPLIEGIMIEGHTNSKGEANRNWALSSERALNSLKHLFTLPEIKKHPQRYKALLFAGAFGENRPVLRKGREQANLSRRIEIRILFNHSQTQSLTNDLKSFSTLP